MRSVAVQFVILTTLIYGVVLPPQLEMRIALATGLIIWRLFVAVIITRCVSQQATEGTINEIDRRRRLRCGSRASRLEMYVDD